MTGKKCQRMRQFVSWTLEELLFIFLCFLKKFLYFCCLQLMNFGLCFSWNVATHIKNWWWSYVSKILFYCEGEDEVTRLTMHLVVDGDKYHKVKKVKHSWIQIHFFDFMFLVLLLWILGRSLSSIMWKFCLFVSYTVLHWG